MRPLCLYSGDLSPTGAMDGHGHTGMYQHGVGLIQFDWEESPPP